MRNGKLHSRNLGCAWLKLAVCCAIANPCFAGVFTVGSGGTHATLESALLAAQSNPGPNEIRIARGVFDGSALDYSFSGPLTVSGGWNDSFSASAPDPAATKITGRGVHRAFADLTFTAGDSIISNLTIEHGYACSDGAGALLSARGTSSLMLQDLDVANNVIDATVEDLGARCLTHAQAAGIFVAASDSAKVMMSGLNFAWNYAFGQVGASALLAAGSERSVMGLETITATNNFAYSAEYYAGPAIALHVIHTASLHFSAGRFEQNSSYAGNIGVDLTWAGGGNANLAVTADGASTVALERLSVRGGAAGGAFRHPTSGIERNRSSVALASYYQGRIRFDDSLVVGSNGLGVRARVYDLRGRIDLVNLTIADHAATGLLAWGPGSQILLSNSIITGNGQGAVSYSAADRGTSSYPGWLQGDIHAQGLNAEWSNLVGTDRSNLFANPDSGNYFIRIGSAAHNSGNNAPFSGGVALAPFDLLDNNRINEDIVDIGAYEISPFAGRFFQPIYFPVDPPVIEPDPIKPITPIAPGKPGG